MFELENSKKSINGNNLNCEMDFILRNLNNIKNIEKEKKFKNVGNYKKDIIIVDNYFESCYQFKVNNQYKNLVFSIDNTTTIRNDRLRGKNEEAFKLKRVNLIDLFLVTTLNFSEFENYKNPTQEKKIIITKNNDILNKDTLSYIDIILPKDLTIKLISEICIKENQNKDFFVLIENILKKYKL